MEANNNTLIGIDLGGTKVAAGKVIGNKLESVICRLIPSASTKVEDTLNLIKEVIKELGFDDVAGIGIGVPGLVDRENGIVYDFQNIPAWTEVELKSLLEAEFNIPVFIDNDANCFALGEYRFGSHKGIDDFVGLTLGTGMGGGIIKNGSLLSDANCASGEFGNISYLNSIYEDYCSGKFFINKYHQSGQIVAAEAERGDKWAIDAFAEFGGHLGKAIQTIKHAVDPRAIIIGGSVAKSRKLFETFMWKTILEFPFPKALKDFDVMFSDTENVAILGAASLFYNEPESKTINQINILS